MSDITVLSIDLIVSNPKIRGGRPIIAGTTLRVQDIVVGYLYKGYSVDDLVEHYPQINHAQVHSALAYYYAHKIEIDAQIKADDEFYQQSPKPVVQGEPGESIIQAVGFFDAQSLAEMKTAIDENTEEIDWREWE